jgi:hypothetical protein
MTSFLKDSFEIKSPEVWTYSTRLFPEYNYLIHPTRSKGDIIQLERTIPTENGPEKKVSNVVITNPRPYGVAGVYMGEETYKNGWKKFHRHIKESDITGPEGKEGMKDILGTGPIKGRAYRLWERNEDENPKPNPTKDNHVGWNKVAECIIINQESEEDNGRYDEMREKWFPNMTHIIINKDHSTKKPGSGENKEPTEEEKMMEIFQFKRAPPRRHREYSTKMVSKYYWEEIKDDSDILLVRSNHRVNLWDNYRLQKPPLRLPTDILGHIASFGGGNGCFVKRVKRAKTKSVMTKKRKGRGRRRRKRRFTRKRKKKKLRY